MFFFKQKTAYEMRSSDWSSDVCSSDLSSHGARSRAQRSASRAGYASSETKEFRYCQMARRISRSGPSSLPDSISMAISTFPPRRSEEHTSELQSLMRITYAAFCLKKKQDNKQPTRTHKSSHRTS